jgi:hypothetical protein
MAEKQTLYFDQADTVWSVTVPRGMKIPVTAELLGGGGGGGGSDSHPGGSGAAGQYLKYDFTVSKGDVISFVVGGGGGKGASHAKSSGAGTAGTSLIALPRTVFTPRYYYGEQPVYAQTYGAWSYFMNQASVWDKDNVLEFNRVYDVEFPIDDTYQFKVQCYGRATVYLDDVKVGTSSKWTAEDDIFAVPVTKGTHTVRIEATATFFAARGVAVEILNGPGLEALDWQESLSGGRGGNAGTRGTSGGGGGGGGASAILVNGEIVAIAGGGGGGGGGGNHSNGENASNTPSTTSKYYNGQEGQPERADGGGGGGAGGGYRAGAGGKSGQSDRGGKSGQSAGCWAQSNEWNSIEIQNGSGRTPYGGGSQGNGGAPAQSGTSGYVRLSFDTTICSFKKDGVWEDISEVYIKDSGTWKNADVYTKIDGKWVIVSRRDIAKFDQGNGVVGVYDRDNPMRPPPPPPPPTYSYSYGGRSGSNYRGGTVSRVTDRNGNAISTGTGGILNSSAW